MAYNNLEEYLVPASYFQQGGLWLWGLNSTGQLGNNNTTAYSSPIQTIASGTNWKQVDIANGGHSGAIKTDGTLWLWGQNTNGQLGDNTVTTRSSPIQTIAAGTNWKQVSCNRGNTAAIKTDGTLWIWGRNSTGQLGNNTSTFTSSPVQTIAGGGSWKLVSCGPYHSASVKTDGTLWLWGYGANGEMGDNAGTNRSSPVQTISAGTNWKLVSCGYYSTIAIKTDGTLWTWGANDFGQLGDNTTVRKSSPVQTISGGANWKSLSGRQKTVVTTKTDGTLWLWGENSYGQLGDNTIGHKSSPVQTIAGGTNWKQATAGVQNAGAIKTDSTLWVWGQNTNGQLGNNNTGSSSSPIQTISAGTNWKQVAIGTASVLSINGTWGTIT